MEEDGESEVWHLLHRVPLQTQPPQQRQPLHLLHLTQVDDLPPGGSRVNSIAHSHRIFNFSEHVAAFIRSIVRFDDFVRLFCLFDFVRFSSSISFIYFICLFCSSISFVYSVCLFRSSILFVYFVHLFCSSISLGNVLLPPL